VTKLIAFTSIVDGDKIAIVNSWGDGVESSDLSTLLHWLKYSRTDGALRVVWDLDAFLAPVLRKMSVSLLKLIASNDNGASFDGDTIFYALHKMARFRQAYYYGIQEFWATNTPPPSSVDELQQRADELTDALVQLGMGDFQRIASPIAIFEQTELGQKTYEQIPRDYDVPQYCSGMLEYADKADRKEWITNYQIGHWDNLYDWDISAAYSYEASRLPHIQDLEFWKSNSIGSREDGALFGFVKGRMWVDPDHPMQHCSPVMVNDGVFHGNPAGWLEPDCYSLDEVRFTTDNGLGGFIMEDGYFAKVVNGVRPRYPLRAIMERLYNLRGMSPVASSVVKAVANQLVGKLVERLRWRNNTEGEIYNSVYHSLITSGCRVKVAHFLLGNDIGKDELVAVQTDGCRITKDIPSSGNGMGRWRCNGSSPVLVASPNIVLVGDKKPQHYTHDTIMSEIREHPRQSYYGMEAPHCVTLGQAIEWGDITKVGEVIQLPASLDLLAIPRQQNRVFKKLPVTGEQLIDKVYDSELVIRSSVV
jgi:hypothetical protein